MIVTKILAGLVCGAAGPRFREYIVLNCLGSQDTPELLCNYY